MSSGCGQVAQDPNSVGAAPTTQSGPISSSAKTAEMPTLDVSSMAMYPTVIGWGVVGIFGALLVMFLLSYLAGISSVGNWWSIFIWSSLIILLVILATINGSYTSMLVNMHMCTSALNSFIQVSLLILGLITIILWYIMNHDFGTNQNVNTYLFIMLHVNLLCSLLNLCLVTMQQLSGVNIKS
jgi:hypothetical protein